MSRLDRLVIILETGSNSFVRNTAADQLADLAKMHPHDILNLISRVYPFLFHKKWETRIAAARAFGGIVSNVSKWDPNQNDEIEGSSIKYDESENLDLIYQNLKKDEELDDFEERNLKTLLNTDEYESILVSFDDWSLDDLLASGSKLLSTSSDSFNSNCYESTSNYEKNFNLTKKLGFDEFFNNLKHEDPSERSISPNPETLTSTSSIKTEEPSSKSPKVSARMRALAKRKAKFGNYQPNVDISKSTISNHLSATGDLSNSSESPAAPDIDISIQNNGTKMMVESKPTQESLSSFSKFENHVWILQGVYELLIKTLFSPNWESRHGAALGLREIMKYKYLAQAVGRVSTKSRSENNERNEKTLEDLVVRILSIFAMDRFGDYVSDTVIAPVRENAAQILAALLRWINDDTVIKTFNALCELVTQDNVTGSCWEAKHGGLLGLRYFVSIKPDTVLNDSSMLSQISKIVINCLRGGSNDFDRDDDVQTVAASILLPITSEFVKLQHDQVKELLYVLWGCLIDLKDDLAAATGSVMDLLGRLCSEEIVTEILHEMSISSEDWNFTKLVPRLYPFLRHSLLSVRRSVLNTLLSFINISDKSMHQWINGHIIRLIFQNILMERNDEILELSSVVFYKLVENLTNNNVSLEEIFKPHILPCIDLLTTPIGLPRFNYSMNPSSIMRASGHTMSMQDIQLTGINYKNVQTTTPSCGLDDVERRRKRKNDSLCNNDILSPGVTSSGIPTSEYDLHVNIDAPMINGDVTLVPTEIILKTRLYGACALGKLTSMFVNIDLLMQIFELIRKKLESEFLTTRLISSWIFKKFFDFVVDDAKVDKGKYDTVAQFINPILLEILQTDTLSLPFFKEIVPLLRSTRSHCGYMLSLFREQARLPLSKMKNVAILVTGERDAGPDAFSLNDAKHLIGEWYEISYKSLNATARISFGSALENAKKRVEYSIVEVETELSSRLHALYASVAGTYIHSVVLEVEGKLPNKMNPIIRSLMDGVKLINSSLIQDETAKDVAYLVNRLIEEGRSAISDKIVKNLSGFLCVDPAEVPEFTPNKSYNGILSLIREGRDANMVDEVETVPDRTDEEKNISDFEVRKAIIKRRGGKVTLESLAKLFGNKLFTQLGKLKVLMFEPLERLDQHDLSEKECQNIIDSYELVRCIFPCIAIELRDEILDRQNLLLKGLSSNESVFRYMSAKCLSIIISTCPTSGFQFLVDKMLPLLNNPSNVNERQGAIECIYHVVYTMGSTILPYVVFLLVPTLGRMSDSNRDVRLISTSTFAQIIKLVPLESGIPDPVDMPESLLVGRQKEREFLSQMMDPSKIEPFALPVAIKATLRKYQQEGVNWLYFLNKYHLHGILCDDMGLGKTLQTICMIASDHYLRNEEFEKNGSIENRKLPSLIVCPPSLTGHWEEEFHTFAEFMRVVVYAGPPSIRTELKSTINKGLKDDIDIIVTSYDVVRNDIDFISGIDFNYCVLDEGHIIKNAKSALSKSVKQLKAEHRLILSGTPIQNNVVELWSLFDFLMPGFLGTYKQFDRKFAKPIALSKKNKGKKEQENGALVLESLHKQVLPFMLRRLKEDVLADLPPKIIQDYYCELSNLQKQLYKDFISKQKQNIIKDLENDHDEVIDEEESKMNGSKQHVFQVLQYMRKLCNHPSLVLNKNHPQYGEVIEYLNKSGMKLDDIEHGPKLIALKNLLKECGIGLIGNESTVISQHRALIFCQMKDMLDIVENELIKKHMPNVSYLRMDGSTDARFRQQIVKKFNEDPSIDVLLLTTKVGGLGLNLTGADTVIFVEHDWNPMNDLQAMDRAHRLGQKRVVNVYRLITKDTLEEKIMGLQKFKMNIASSIVNQQNAGLASMDTHQLLDLFESDNVKEGMNDNEFKHHTQLNEKIEEVTDENGIGGKAGSAVKQLGELWDEKQYEEEYNLNQFIQTLQ
ncbi:hypothetical protein CANINC_001390 [Pichia inconspicua]|uniref:TATA-binding protein-associated factor mot1 n=1 Tax=Pichia inconspicua TaxID=52247 RepID=A0A4T0X3Q2_9ASCO|nr:hypothetical protein CANINC_001390 [[Candida] inconspicua]